MTEGAFHIKDDFGNGDKINSVTHEWLNTVARVLNQIAGKGCAIRKKNSGYNWTIEVDGSSTGSSSEFGVKLTDTTALTITINGGHVVHGSYSASCSDTVVLAGGTSSLKHYIFAYGTLNPLTVAISATSTPTFPINAANQWRFPLQEVYISGGAIVLKRLHDGFIPLTSFYGP